jgi:hypothetical protein
MLVELVIRREELHVALGQTVLVLMEMVHWADRNYKDLPGACVVLGPLRSGVKVQKNIKRLEGEDGREIAKLTVKVPRIFAHFQLEFCITLHVEYLLL